MESKFCTKCKTELPIGSFRWKKDAKYRAGGRYRSDCRKCELDARDKEKKRKADLDRGKRIYGTPAYNEIQNRSVEKRKAAHKAAWHERNTGKHTPIKWIKCVTCESIRLFKGKQSFRDSYTCATCMHIVRSANQTGRPLTKKILNCIDCNVVIHGTLAKKRCVKCQRKRSRKAIRLGVVRNDNNIARRARQHGVQMETIRRKAVYDRDGWLCYLCGVDLVMSKAYAPNQATIDHVIPLSLGGSHTYSNVKACCHRCNSLKGNKMIMQSVDAQTHREGSLPTRRFTLP